MYGSVAGRITLRNVVVRESRSTFATFQ